MDFSYRNTNFLNPKKESITNLLIQPEENINSVLLRDGPTMTIYEIIVSQNILNLQLFYRQKRCLPINTTIWRDQIHELVAVAGLK